MRKAIVTREHTHHNPTHQAFPDLVVSKLSGPERGAIKAAGARLYGRDIATIRLVQSSINGDDRCKGLSLDGHSGGGL